MAPGHRHFRSLFPAALLLLGAAVSLWCACFSPPRATPASEIQRRQLQQELAKALPSPLDEIPPNAIKIRVFGFAGETGDNFTITITGPFTPENAKAMAEHVREVHRATPGKPRFTVRIFDNTAVPQVLLERFELAKEN
jgi:hypothetical protein